MGGCYPLGDSAWQLLQLAVEKPWSAPGGPFVCFLARMGKCSFHLVGTPFQAFLHLMGCNFTFFDCCLQLLIALPTAVFCIRYDVWVLDTLRKHCIIYVLHVHSNMTLKVLCSVLKEVTLTCTSPISCTPTPSFKQKN